MSPRAHIITLIAGRTPLKLFSLLTSYFFFNQRSLIVYSTIVMKNSIPTIVRSTTPMTPIASSRVGFSVKLNVLKKNTPK